MAQKLDTVFVGGFNDGFSKMKYTKLLIKFLFRVAILAPSARLGLNVRFALTLIYFLIMLFCAIAIITYFASMPIVLSMAAFEWFSGEKIPVRTSNHILFTYLIVPLVIMGLVKREYYRIAADLDGAAGGRFHFWLSRSAWVTGWVFALVTALIYISRINSDLLGLGTVEENFGRWAATLYALDIFLGAVFFDFFDVFNMTFSGITPQSTLEKSFNFIARLMVSLTLVRVLVVLRNSSAATADASNNNEDSPGFLGICVVMIFVSAAVYAIWFVVIIVLSKLL